MATGKGRPRTSDRSSTLDSDTALSFPHPCRHKNATVSTTPTLFEKPKPRNITTPVATRESYLRLLCSEQSHAAPPVRRACWVVCKSYTSSNKRCCGRRIRRCGGGSGQRSLLGGAGGQGARTACPRSREGAREGAARVGRWQQLFYGGRFSHNLREFGGVASPPRRGERGRVGQDRSSTLHTN